MCAGTTNAAPLLLTPKAPLLLAARSDDRHFVTWVASIVAGDPTFEGTILLRDTHATYSISFTGIIALELAERDCQPESRDLYSVLTRIARGVPAQGLHTVPHILLMLPFAPGRHRLSVRHRGGVGGCRARASGVFNQCIRRVV